MVSKKDARCYPGLTIDMFACYSGRTWGAFVHFAASVILSAALCMVVGSRQRPSTPRPAPTYPASIKWYAIAITPPTTSGGQVQRRVKTKSEEPPKKTPNEVAKSIPSGDLGKIIFDPPDRMTVAKADLVEAVVVKDNVNQAITDQMVSQVLTTLKGRGKPEVDQLKVSSRMSVDLIGDDFTIVRRSSREQAVDDSEPTNWSWSVTPKRAGSLVLTLRATRVVQIKGDGQVPRDLPSFDRTVVVEANRWYSAKHWMGENKVWLIPTALSVIALIQPYFLDYLKKRRRRRRQNEALKRELTKLD